ncbi:erythroblast NAD(P)(+)--arginine ADP-ribosyltransferase-like [Poecilia formosa]|uniref:NAD(P)(+)--arginine ADP-ribosyltransferase n=1 Tax=Poecilia formosa TaxID=48698 RepID=A0A087Y565_POEFO|nr:PREDICTED: erythroblast NAD(P)(+)--arginine ADP-ribosyltransferase-like [Poecilia formosa]
MGRLVIWVTVFMLFASCVGTPLEVFKKFWQKVKNWIRGPIKLDMAKTSVDDMYDKCEHDMEKKVKEKFLQNEKNKSKTFQQAWDKAEKYYKTTWKNMSTPLKKEQIMALYAYTLNVPPLYREFNNAVRKQKSKYKTKFQYHTLHFYLTMALRTIKPKAENCVTVFRRTNCKFSKNVLNKEIRLGAFSSSSMGDYPCEKTFGNQSCFEISTCFGANISEFSSIKSEREVLIPPYEVFKVTGINKASDNTLPCEVVYKLRSTNRPLSNLNCALFKRKTSAWF